eukprot:scaffold10.g2283.t1
MSGCKGQRRTKAGEWGLSLTCQSPRVNARPCRDAPLTRRAPQRAGRLVSTITREELESCFHMPSEQACKHLGVGLTILKRVCRRFGIPRWPYSRAGRAYASTQHHHHTQPQGPLGAVDGGDWGDDSPTSSSLPHMQHALHAQQQAAQQAAQHAAQQAAAWHQASLAAQGGQQYAPQPQLPPLLGLGAAHPQLVQQQVQGNALQALLAALQPRQATLAGVGTAQLSALLAGLAAPNSSLAAPAQPPWPVQAQAAPEAAALSALERGAWAAAAPGAQQLQQRATGPCASWPQQSQEQQREAKSEPRVNSAAAGERSAEAGAAPGGAAEAEPGGSPLHKAGSSSDRLATSASDETTLCLHGSAGQGSAPAAAAPAVSQGSEHGEAQPAAHTAAAGSLPPAPQAQGQAGGAQAARGMSGAASGPPAPSAVPRRQESGAAELAPAWGTTLLDLLGQQPAARAAPPNPALSLLAGRDAPAAQPPAQQQLLALLQQAQQPLQQARAPEGAAGFGPLATLAAALQAPQALHPPPAADASAALGLLTQLVAAAAPPPYHGAPAAAHMLGGTGHTFFPSGGWGSLGYGP